MRLATSWIMPPRPKRASLPVIVKSVSTSTRVPPPSGSSETRETIVALAPPCPRLSVPRALIVATRASSSRESIFSVPA